MDRPRSAACALSPKPCFIAGGALGEQRAWQLADESGPVRPGAAPRVPSVAAAGVHGDAHAEVLAGGEGVEAVAAEGGERRGRVVPESKVMHDRMAVTAKTRTSAYSRSLSKL